MLDSVVAGTTEPRRAWTATAALVPLFATTLFAASFLLFLVEPMIAKMVLPILGGAPMVWNACVLFFQTALLAGYGYAYAAAAWLDLRRHAALHVVVIAAPLFGLPVLISAGHAPHAGTNPVGWLLLLLTTTIGLPFFAIATTASVLQHWFAQTDHTAAADPYFLYASSNLGSLVALAAYPLVIEPTLPLRLQSHLWAVGYAILVALICGCAAVASFRWRPRQLSYAAAPDHVEEDEPAVGWPRRGRWLLLALVPSSLMLGVTNFITTDVAAMPLLWVVPLALYLLTFVLAFGRSGDRRRDSAVKTAPLVLVLLVFTVVAGIRAPLALILPLHLLAFGVLALQCHRALAADRPGATRLTEFYFWLSCGGMLGGLFNVLVAPVLFTHVIEYPLMLVLACVLAPAAARKTTRRWISAGLVTAIAIGVATSLVLVLARRDTGATPWILPPLCAIAVATFAQRRSAWRFAAALAAMLVAGARYGDISGQALHSERTFFGVYRVIEDARARYHGLMHGTTLHGMQALDPAHREEPLTYYHRTGPFGQAFAELPHARDARAVAVVGLGVGTLAAYAEPGQQWTFYEIDPAVEKIARNERYFSFLTVCGDRCRVVVGDARLSLAAAPPHAYDLIVLDAFSSDAIPMHLMTDEALSLYLSRLTARGALAFHITNRHLRLGPVVGRLAANHQLQALEETDRAASDVKSESQWVVMARAAADLGGLVHDARWAPPAGTLRAPLWTDDFSNVVSVLNVWLNLR